ncbi:MAG: fibronectin [Candidatus Delongbacteria bacterium]|nr:fibronectin [Candidatus Delongbacteria bacterium]
MRKTISPNIIIVLIVVVLSLAGNRFMAHADEIKWVAVGSLHNWFSSAGCEREIGRTLLTRDQQDGLRWNAQFNWQDVKAAKALWIGAVNYNDPLVNKTYNYKVVHCGPRILDDQAEFMPQEFVLYGKYDHPTVVIDGVISSKISMLDEVDEIVDTMKADRLLYNVVNTSIGVTITRRIYAWVNPYYDNFYICDYVFKNTGIIDKKGTVNAQNLDGVYINFMHRYSMTREASGAGLNYLPQSAGWGHNTILDTRGEVPGSGDPFRCQYAWHGKHSKCGFDNIGGPYQTGDGRLGAAQFVGTVILHADKSASDPSNDPYQPKTTNYISSDAPITSSNSQFNESQMAAEYAYMISGHPAVRHADMVKNDYADVVGGTPGGYSSSQGFGPYTLNTGDSIRIIMGEAVNGLSRTMCFDIGRKWLDKAAPYTLPDGSSGSDPDAFKNAWVYTGRDSLFLSFNRMVQLYQNGFNLPSPPPPPNVFEVTSGGDRIILNWSNSAETWPNFKGYRLYRAIHTSDTLYDMIYECGEGTPNALVNQYNDMTALRGFDYYYYISSFDDGSTNTIQPGVAMESSKFFTITTEPAYLRRAAGTRMADIRIVPNPYNIKARDIQFGDGGKDRIMFYNLPPVCTIKIFTARGDLIETLHHTSGSGDEAWNSVSQYRQVVVSGLYIAHFETPDGESIIKKFIIIR